MMVRYGQIDKAPPVREWIDPAYLWDARRRPGATLFAHLNLNRLE